MSADAKEKLIQTTISMLEEYDDIDKVTSRSISARSGVNQAMINYYFGSKDELLKLALSKIIDKSAENMYEIRKDMAPKDALNDFLLKMSKTMVMFEKYTKVYVPDLLLKDEPKVPLMIVPFISSHYGGRKSECECRFIAYQIVSTFQLILYRMDEFNSYFGLDLRDEANIKRIIEMESDLMLAD